MEFNPKYKEEKGELIKKFNLLHTDIFGNREFLKYLREEQKFYCKSENRELDLRLIDYDVTSNNVYEVTEEFYYHNVHFGNREDVVLLINGIPVLVIECKNATRDEAIALGIDQVRRYHDETPERCLSPNRSLRLLRVSVSHTVLHGTQSDATSLTGKTKRLATLKPKSKPSVQ